MNISSYTISNIIFSNDDIPPYATGIKNNILIIGGDVYKISSIVSAERCSKDIHNNKYVSNKNIDRGRLWSYNDCGLLITFSSGTAVVLQSYEGVHGIDQFLNKLISAMNQSDPISMLLDSTPAVRDAFRVLLDALESCGK